MKAALKATVSAPLASTIVMASAAMAVKPPRAQISTIVAPVATSARLENIASMVSVAAQKVSPTATAKPLVVRPISTPMSGNCGGLRRNLSDRRREPLLLLGPMWHCLPSGASPIAMAMSPMAVKPTSTPTPIIAASVPTAAPARATQPVAAAPAGPATSNARPVGAIVKAPLVVKPTSTIQRPIAALATTPVGPTKAAKTAPAPATMALATATGAPATAVRPISSLAAKIVAACNAFCSFEYSCTNGVCE